MISDGQEGSRHLLLQCVLFLQVCAACSFRFVWLDRYLTKIGHFVRCSVAKRQREEQSDHSGEGAGDVPYHLPILYAVHGKRIYDKPGEERTEPDANSVGDQRNETLGAGSDVAGGFSVGVDLAGDEEEIVADSV